MEDQVEVIKSNKGGMKVIHKGYMYTVHKKRQCGGIRWRCAQRSLHCKGSISTGTEGAPKINMPHNHLPDLHSVALARGRQSDDFGPFTHLLDVKFEEDPGNFERSTMRRKGRYSRHLYNAYDLDLKKSVIIFAEQNGNKEAQAHYGISEANIRRWRRLKYDIFGKPHDYDRGKLRSRRRVDYTSIKVENEPPDQDTHSQSSVGESQHLSDSMPLQERLSKVVAQEKIAAGATGPLKSQPLSPTKLKVTRQSSKATVKHMEPPQSPVNEEMCLRWNSHHSNMQTAFPSILLKEQYVDVTLAAEGKTLKCHRLILSSCSPYFEEILSGISPFQHPVLFMRDIPFWILKSLCDFMYAGEVHIFQNKLEELLTVAEALKIKGLAGKSTPPENQEEQHSPQQTKTEASNSTNNNREHKKKPQQQHHHQEDKRSHPQPVKKNPVFSNSNNYESTSQDYDNEDLLDPLDLLEPLYEEAAEEKKPSTIVKPKENKFQYQPIKKPFTRRLRKRKYSEQRDPSPPPVFSFRKGTRSRPNVKIPKFYHPDYSNTPKPPQNSQTDPLLEVDEIKTEPIDVEDNLIDYSDDEHHFIENNSIGAANCDSPIIITSKGPPASSSSPPAKFKKIKLSKPVITDVHSIDERNTTAGGLEVIKITVRQPDDVAQNAGEKKEEGREERLLVEDATPTIVQVESEEIMEEGAVNEETDVADEPPLESEEIHAEKPEDAEVAENENVEDIPGNCIEELPAEMKEDEEMQAETREDEEIPAEMREDEEMPAEIREDEDIPAEIREDDGIPAEVKEDEEMPAEEKEITEDNEERAEDEEEEGEIREDEEKTEYEEMTSKIHIEDVRTACAEEIDQLEEEQRRTSSLDHLEKEAMNVANAITKENQGPPDIDDCK